MKWRKQPVPVWLLQDLGMSDGIFNDDGTMLTGHYDPHNSAVLNVGSGSPRIRTVVLTSRPEWPEVKKKLEQEFLAAPKETP